MTAGDAGLVDIHVPITINVPDWFDADMDIHIQLTISRSTNGHVFVAAPVVDPTAEASRVIGHIKWRLLRCGFDGDDEDGVRIPGADCGQRIRARR